ncbi:MAG: O-methyltransferase [Melioribacteraceae bacterium]|nr:O-methyltransferase [Melioribacteraceae bacterium]
MPKIVNRTQEKYLKSFLPPKDELIDSMEKYAMIHRIPILHWQSAEFLEKLIIIHRPKMILEIGCAIAYSAIRMAMSADKISDLHTIEKSKDNITIARKNIIKSGLEKRIKLIEGDALDILPELSCKYDFIFLDADKEDYIPLFMHSLKLLKTGGVIVIDNLLWHGYAASAKVPRNLKKSVGNIRKFNILFMSNDQLNAIIIPVGDGLGVGIKNRAFSNDKRLKNTLN